MFKMRVTFALVLTLCAVAYCHHVRDMRVIGGHVVSIKDYPFTVSLIVKGASTRNSEVFAGGAVILSQSWALTAAHCVGELMEEYLPQGYVYVRSNTTFSSGPLLKYASDHLVLKAVIHELYDTDTDDYDVAALKVKQRFNGKFSKPIKFLAKKNYNYKSGSTATVLGWGTTKMATQQEPIVETYTVENLRGVEVDLVDQRKCVQIYRDINETVTPRMLCANAPGKDACVNDSGGPLVQNNDTLIGLVSWGIGCANYQYPGIYTRISTVEEWVRGIQKTN